ncbi:MAG: hypothetical protein DRO62_01990 [Candidatus Altiarchaeales archaeon]|nr:MAG: hypothetical protein DRO62_01990 [Candidatus Altiarchaeales archaeon]
MKDRKGQSASFDIILVLVAITIFIAVVGSFLDDGTVKTETIRVRNDYTHSLLVSMLRCTVNSSLEYENKTISDLIAFYFQNSTRVNKTITDEITTHMNLYTEDRGIEWVVYGNKTEILWVPWGKILKGRGISSSSAEILLPDGEGVRVHLFIKWG